MSKFKLVRCPACDSENVKEVTEPMTFTREGISVEVKVTKWVCLDCKESYIDGSQPDFLPEVYKKINEIKEQKWKK